MDRPSDLLEIDDPKLEFCLYEDCDEFEGDIDETGEDATLQGFPKDKALKYTVLVSLLLHALLFVGIPNFLKVPATDSRIRPDEQVTKVRLIESQPETKEEPPPDTTAFSDRNHVAEKERLPKVMPAPQAPLGKVEPVEQKLASLPPSAPDLAPKEQETEETEQPPVEEKPDKVEKPKPEEPKRVEKPPKSRPRPKAQHKPTRKPTHNTKVDLRPTAQDFEKGMAKQYGGPDFYPDGEIEEAVVDINTKEDRYFSYLLHLKHKIQGVWVYPSVAARSGIGGSLTVEFSIEKNGALAYVNLLDSSGHTILDESALKAIKGAAPYFPLPSRMKAKKLKVRANFIYLTQNFFRNIM